MLRELHIELGIPDDYGSDGARPEFEEADDLVEVGPNLVGRMQRLTPETAASWQEMQAAARDDGITLLIVSGFRTSPRLQDRMVSGEATWILTELKLYRKSRPRISLASRAIRPSITPITSSAPTK